MHVGYCNYYYCNYYTFLGFDGHVKACKTFKLKLLSFFSHFFYRFYEKKNHYYLLHNYYNEISPLSRSTLLFKRVDFI